MIAVALSISAALSVFLLAVWYAFGKRSQEERLRVLLEPQRMVIEHNDPFSQRVAFPVMDFFVRACIAILPTQLVTRSRDWLVTAGDRLSLAQFISLALMSAAGLAALTFVFVAVLLGQSSSAALLIALPVLTGIGFLLPFAFLRIAAASRQRVIWKSLPSSLDLLTTCVEAGLSLDFAMQRVAERYKGPFADETNRALREIALGKLRRDALLDMASRIALPDVTTFINSLLQAEALGTSVGQVLRIQAGQMRTRRRQRAEEQTRKAPVKMVVPLVFFLMPSLFIVTLGPVTLAVIKAFSNG